MFEPNDYGGYTDIRLSQIVKKFEQATSYPQIDPTRTKHPPSKIDEYQKQIEYLKSQIVQLPLLQIELSKLQRQYQIIEHKYESLLGQNIRLHSLNQGGSGLQKQLSLANDKISSLLRTNEFLEKQKICIEKEFLSLKNIFESEELRGLKLQGQYHIVATEKIQLQQTIDEQRKQKHSLLNRYERQIKDLKAKMEENQIKFRGERYTIQSLESLKLNLQIDIKELRQTVRGLQEGLRVKNDQNVALEVKIKQISVNQEESMKLKKQIEIKDKLFRDMKSKAQQQNRQNTAKYEAKIRNLLQQNQSLKASLNHHVLSYQNLKTDHKESVSVIQAMHTHLSSYKDSASQLQLQNNKLESALRSSRVESEQTKRRNLQLSRVSQDAEHYKQQSGRLKQQVQLIRRRSKQMEHNYRSLLDHVKDKQSLGKSRQTHQSRKSTRAYSNTTLEPYQTSMTLSSDRTKSCHKNRTELSELTPIDQYKNVIESKLLKPSTSRNESMNENVMKRCKMFINK